MKEQEQQPSDEQLERYIELCKRIYERMRRENSWPWLSCDDPLK